MGWISFISPYLLRVQSSKVADLGTLPAVTTLGYLARKSHNRDNKDSFLLLVLIPGSVEYSFNNAAGTKVGVVLV